MTSKASLLLNLLMAGAPASYLFAASDLPVETIQKMAELNPVNGRCSFNKVEVQEDQGEKSLSFELSIDDRTISSTLSLNQMETQWSESRGINENREPLEICFRQREQIEIRSVDEFGLERKG